MVFGSARAPCCPVSPPGAWPPESVLPNKTMDISIWFDLIVFFALVELLLFLSGILLVTVNLDILVVGLASNA